MMTNEPLGGRTFDGDRNIAETIDALYRQSAVPRHHDRLVDLIVHQLRHVYFLGHKAGYQVAVSKNDQ